jgi:hypothetical protein
MPRTFLQKLVLLAALTLSTLVQSGIGAAQSPGPGPAGSYEEALARLDRIMVAAEDLRAEIDRTQFDLEALGLALGFDAADVVAFVRDQIAFEQYAGLLRGAKGTLIGRAGNALDQAVLLTTLLAYAGYEARIVRGELTPEQSRSLIDQMAAPRAPEPAIGDEEAMRAILVELGRTAGLPDEEISRQVEDAFNPPDLASTHTYQAAQADTDFLLAQLADAGVGLGDPNAVADLVEEARDYFWVEYRLGPSDAWEAVHPAFKDAGATPVDPEVREYLPDPRAIPKELQHRFRFQVFIEQWVKGELIEHPVMSAWEAPVADLVGAPVTYQNQLDGLPGESDAFDLDAAIDRSELIIPVVNDTFPSDLRVFDLTGTPTEFDEIAPNEYAATFNLGELIGTGPDGVDLFGSPDPGGEVFPVLSAQWIDYTFIAPEGKETSYRRTILDRIGSDNRIANRVHVSDNLDERAVRAALLQQYTFAIASAAFQPAFVLDTALQRLIAARPFLELGLRRHFFPDQPAHLPETFDGLDNAWAQYLAIYAAFDEGSRQSSIVAYRHQPSLVVYGVGSRNDDSNETELTVQRSVDVVTNARRAVSVGDGNIEPAPDHLVWMGVWETYAESLALADDPGAGSFSTMAALERAAAAAIDVQLVTTESDLVSAGLTLPTHALANLRADLARGYVAIVPTDMPPGEEMTGWWRVDPRTGETLGMTSDGRGGAAEYTVLTAIVLGTTNGVVDGLACGYASDKLGGSYGKAFLSCFGMGFATTMGYLGRTQVNKINVAVAIVGLLVGHTLAVWP